MAHAKLRKLIIELQAILDGKQVVSLECSYYHRDIEVSDQLPHAKWMLGELLSHLEKWEMDKINRWIGFIQGYFSAHNILSIKELRDLTRDCLK